MDKHTSVYLDLVRFLAAILVMFSHLNFDCFYNIYPDKFKIGFDAVVLFFVLSGYVIAYVTVAKEKNIKEYFISRFARLYSVVLPALAITFIADKIGMMIYPGIYWGHYIDTLFFFKLLLNATFTNQLWFNGSQFLSNAPMWSLGYEFWYYVLFGYAFFINNKILKYFLIITTCLFIGPKILILMPIWLLGILIYYLHKKITLKETFAKYAFLTSLILLCLFVFVCHSVWLNPYFLDLKYNWSCPFLTAYLLGIIISLNFLFVKYANFNILLKYENTIRNLASMTFSIYLYHLPLLFFYGAVLRHKAGNLHTLSLITLFTLFSIFVLAQFTEKKKHVFKKYIIEIYDFIASLATLLFSSSTSNPIPDEVKESESTTTA